MAGANPFLSDADFTDYGNGEADVAVSHMNINSNPFLTGSDYNISDAGSENPFLSGAGDGGDNEDGSFLAGGGGGGTNPFASDFAGDASEVDFFGMGVAKNEPDTSAAVPTSAASAFQDIFSDVVSEDPPASAPSPMAPTSIAAPVAVQASNPTVPGRPPPPHPPPPRPPPASAHFHPSRPPAPAHDIFGVDAHSAPAPKAQEAPMMDLLGGDEDDEATSAETSQIMSRQEEMQPPMGTTEQQAAHTAHHAPGRPPPPRPAPPSRETQELILSVTGAMEATSSHLLDRLRATKTPSPTPIRELHSPSPSPDPTASFLMSEEPPSADLMLGEATTGEDATRRDRTPSPQTQVAPFPSVEAPPADDDFLDIFGGGEGGADETAHAAQHAPSKPPPAHPAPPTSNADLLGLFGAETTPESTIAATEAATVVTSAAESLFSAVSTSAPVAPSSAADLLMGDFGEPEVEAKAQLQQMTAVTEEVNFLAGPPEETQTVLQESTAAAPAEVGGFGSVGGGAADSDFDAFAAKFESAAKEDEEPRAVEGGDPFDPFASAGGGGGGGGGGDAWGSAEITDGGGGGGTGFGGEEDQFDAFLSMSEPLAPAPTPIPTTAIPTQPSMISRRDSADSDDGGPDFSIFIKPKAQDEDGAGDFDATGLGGAMPTLAPPPKSPVNAAYSEPSAASRFNPFDKSGLAADATGEPSAGTIPPTTLGLESNQAQAIGIGAGLPGATGEPGLPRSDSQETPPTPLFDEDVSQPLEEFPRTLHDEEDGWEMQLRQPNKKKITGQRFWKKVYVKLVLQGDNPVLQLYNTKDDKDPFQELPLQPCYSISDISAQQYDAYGKIFTVKLQYVFYKERPGVRPGQVTKAERITNKLSQFAAYAIQGDYQGVKEFGSDLKKLGLPVEHAPQISQLLKLGSQSYEDLKKFSVVVEEALFRLSAHRDRALNYKSDEVQITAVDELYVEQNNQGHVTRQIARVRVFFLGFITGMPDIELGVNDMVRQGKEVVGRHDIIPVVTEEWIRLENVEFHSCVETSEYETTRVIKFKPPDACYIELMRFRIRPPKNRELPLQLKVTTCTTGNKIEIKGDILVPGFASRKLGQVPCEDIAVRFPVPECWIYLFRVEKHFRYGSVKSAHRRTGKIKGIERLLGTVETLDQSLIEVTSGQAKYEHQHRAIVWRMSRLPKEGQGAYTTHQFVCRLALTSYDQMPEKLDPYVYVEFTMPATQVSHTTIRSVSVSGGDNDPPEKYVRYLARHEYRVEVERTQGPGPGAYVAATLTAPKAPEPVVEEEKPDDVSAKDSDSDSSS